METKRTYQAKFALLDETTNNSINNKKFIWISVFILATVLGILLMFFYWKIFLVSFENQNYPLDENISTESTSVGFGSPVINLFSKKVWTPGIDNCLELIYSDVESQNYLPAVFNIYTQENIKISLASVYGYLNMDLFLYYDRIINKHSTKTLKGIFENFQKDLQGSQDLLEFINKLKFEKFKFYIKYLKENNLKAEVKYFLKFVKLTEELKDWYVYLENLRGFLSRYEQQKRKKEYYKNISDRNFLKFTKNTQKIIQGVTNTFNITEKKLNEINNILEEWMKPPKVTFENSIVKIYNKVLLISEVKNQLKTLNESSITSLYIFASHTVYLDEDLVIFGVNIVIIAPKWVFLKKININLSGRGGSEFNKQSAAEGSPGYPGNPGGNSGDFFGIGEINEKFIHIFTNGGKGGDGQSGAKGSDGANNTHPGPQIDKPSCIEKIGDFKNPFGQTITHYKIFNDKGCGSSGTDGGAGGVGGKGGKSVLINTEKMTVSVKQGSDGLNGTPGEGGKGGAGGRNGCFYEVFDVDDEVLHSVTTIKCQINTLPSGNPGKQGGSSIKLIPPSTKQPLTVSNLLFSFYKSIEKDLLKFNDTVTITFFKKLIRNGQEYSLTNSSYSFVEYDVLEKFSRTDLLQVLNNKIDRFLIEFPKDNSLNYVKTLIMGKILSLQKNKNYYFIDIDNYLSTVVKQIKSLNENVINYSTSKIRKNLKMKLIKLNGNLNVVKSDLSALESKTSKSATKFLMSTNVNSTFYKNLAFVLEERRILYITQMLADLMIRFVNLIQNPPFSNKEFKNFLARYSLYYNEMQRKKEEFFNSTNDLSSTQKQILSQIVIKPGEFEEHAQIITKAISFLSDFSHEEKKLAKIWEQFSDEKNFVKEIKDIAECFSESKALSIEGKILLQALTDELDHFIALYYYIERENMEKSFFKSLSSLNLDSEDFEAEKEKLKQLTISMEYNLALDVVQLKVQPLRSLEIFRLSSTDKANEVLFYINHLRTVSKQNTICKKFREGIFDKNSVLGDFYYWSNAEIKNKLKRLFQGEAVVLKSYLNNRHILDKNFIKFKMLKLEFENNNSSLHDILNNFQIEMTHSGYSYYNWGGESYIVISEEITLEYGFKINENGEPEVYNTLFKKMQTGEFMLSPYTVWTIRLSATNNAANFGQLTPFINSTDLRLIGTGSFIS